MAAVVLQEQYGWDEKTKGTILGAFFFGYIWTQILGGALAVRFTGRIVAAVALLIWSVFTLLTPLVVANTWLLILCRIAMGLGEGMELPALHDAISRSFPKDKLSRVVTFITSGQIGGIILGLLCGPIVKKNWAAIFYFFGVVGIFWAFLLLVCKPKPVANPPRLQYANLDQGNPQASGGKDNNENDDVKNGDTDCQKDNQEVAQDPEVETKGNSCVTDCKVGVGFLVQAPAWAVFCAHFGQNWLWYFVINWLPTYLKEALSIPLEQQHKYEITIYVGALIGSNLCGTLADFGINKLRLSRGVVRRIATTLSQIGGGSCFLVIAFVSSPSPLFNAVMLTLCLFMMKMGDSGFFANILEIAPKDAALLLGISNTIATLPGVIANPLSGWLLDVTGTFFWIFVIAFCVTCCAWLVFMLCASGKEMSNQK